MQKFSRDSFNVNEAINELMHESGVIVIENAYNLNDIKEAREIVNHFADTEEQKETHFNAEAEASKQIKLQQRIWNLFGKGDIFSKLISDDIIFSSICAPLEPANIREVAGALSPSIVVRFAGSPGPPAQCIPL